METSTGARVATSGADAERTVLIVEDDADVREALIEVLKASGYPATGCANGREALDWLAQHRAPCVILLDLMMPVMNGYEFRAAQRKEAQLARIPVVLLSARSELSHEAVELQTEGYLGKPIDLAELIAAVAARCPT